MAIKAGKLRPSQAVTQSGPGSLIDLPTLSMIVMAADDWDLARARRIDEPRLARRLKVSNFRSPPYFDREGDIGGVPATVFPRFLVCPSCRRLAPYTGFTFNSRYSDFTCKAPACPGNGKATAYPARFMVACPKGHLDDFPWHRYVHGPGVVCDAELFLEDTGETGALTDLWVKCPVHDKSANVGLAFGATGREQLPACNGARPWFGDTDPRGCTEHVRVLLRGASNAYFPIVDSALSIPPWSDPVQVALGIYAEQMAKVESQQDLEGWLKYTNAPEVEQFEPEQIWAALTRRREGRQDSGLDLRQEEWRALQAEPGKIDPKAEFQSESVAVPPEIGGFVERVVLLERLREVRALRGFTRIDSIPDLGEMGEVEALASGMAPVTRVRQPKWYPGVEFRGEGIFIHLDEEVVREWEERPEIKEAAAQQVQAEEAWATARGFELRSPQPSRYVLLHSLSHAVIRQLALDCGYSSTSLRERIYSSTDPAFPQAGILVYTATPDSDGSLGGLVEMGKPEELGPLVERALRDAELCAGDPFCAGRGPMEAERLNGAACHACLLISETACENGNRYLDRATLVPTLRETGMAISTA
ncbi:MAG TPA: DUF1998 domain-containing protein [Solirubrobacterales bacterium]